MFCDDFCEHRLSLTNRDYDFVSLLRHYHEKGIAFKLQYRIHRTRYLLTVICCMRGVFLNF